MTSRRWLRPAAAMLLVGVLSVWLVGGLRQVRIDSDVDSLLPAGDPSVVGLARAAEDFGGDPVVVLLEGEDEETDPLGSERLEALLQLEGELAALSEAAVVYGPATTLNQTVVRIKQLAATLSGRRDALREAGRERALAAFERRYGQLLLEGLPAGLPTLRNEGFVRSVVLDQVTGRAKPQWRQYVPRDHTAVIYVRPRAGLDQAAALDLTAAVQDLVDASPVTGNGVEATVTGVPVVTAGLADRSSSEVPRIAVTAFVVVALVLVLVPWSRRRRDRLAPLVLMAVATGVVLAWFGWSGDPLSIGAATSLPILLGLGSYYPVYLTHREHRRLVVAAAGGAAAAFAALTLSPLPFVADLGVAIPLGLASVVGLSLMVAWLRPRPTVEHPAGASASAPVAAPARPAKLRAAALGCVLLAVASVAGWIGLGSLPLRTDPQQLLSGLPALDDAVEVQEVLGSGAELAVVLRGPDVVTPEAVAWSADAQRAIVREHGDRVRPIVSLAGLLGFLGEEPTPAQVEAGVAALPEYITAAVLTPERDAAQASYGVSWEDLAADRTLVSDVVATLPPPPAGYDVEVVGLPVAAERGYELVAEDRYSASLIGLGVAALALLVLLRRRGDALLALVAGVLATGTGAALVHLVGASLNPLTSALGVLTAAVGCEFTVLLREARRRGDRALARSVLLAALLSAAGYAVLLTSSLPVLREFGLTLTVSVGLALLSALAVTELAAGLSGAPGGTPRLGWVDDVDDDVTGPASSAGHAPLDLETVGGSR